MVQIRSQRCSQSEGPHACNRAASLMMTKFAATELLGMGSRSLPQPCKIVQRVAGNCRAGIWPSTAILCASWSCKLEGLHAGLGFHLGKFSGRPCEHAEPHNFALEAFANLWNLLILPSQPISLQFGALPGGGRVGIFQGMVATMGRLSFT